ncbi:hypothetical protein F5Y05DRAFT_378551 [Hypoxylon sp. FL0543]|nr:hypothetical protein F5Y05DRAFT_378551 [Hypoxylon sp. FL0543]
MGHTQVRCKLEQAPVDGFDVNEPNAGTGAGTNEVIHEPPSLDWMKTASYAMNASHSSEMGPWGAETSGASNDDVQW